MIALFHFAVYTSKYIKRKIHISYHVKKILIIFKFSIISAKSQKQNDLFGLCQACNCILEKESPKMILEDSSTYV